MTKLLGLLIAALAVTTTPEAAKAQSWPSRPIRFVVPFPPGGPSDILSRLVADRMSSGLGQAVVVENRPGAAGIIGLDAAAKANPDGHTIVLVALSTYVLLQYTHDKLPYDTERDFVPVGLINRVPYVLAVNPKLAAAGVGELISLAKARPGELFYGSPGIGNTAHIAAELLQRRFTLRMEHVVYKGNQPALTDLASGRIQVMFTLPIDALPLAKDGRVRVIATADAQRAQVLPDVPTFRESGIPDFEVTSWFGIAAPTGVPAAVVSRLNVELNKVLSSADVRDRLIAQGSVPGSGSAEEFGRFVQGERAKWGPVMRNANVKPN